MLKVLGVLSLLVSFAAQAQAPLPLNLGAEMPVAPPHQSSEQGGQFPSVASDGRNFMIVSAHVGPAEYVMLHHVSLVDAAGNPLHPTYQFASFGDFDGVASSGRTFLTVWGGQSGTWAALFDSRGELLKQFAVHPQANNGYLPHEIRGRRSVTWDGHEYLVLTRDEKLTLTPFLSLDVSTIMTRISESGDVVEDGIATGFKTQAAEVASRNGVTVVATARQFKVIGGPLVTFNQDAFNVDIAAGEDGFLIVYPTGSAIKAVHLDPSGQLNRNPFTIAEDVDAKPSVTWSGSSYAVTWADPTGVRLAHVTGDGNRLEPVSITIATVGRASGANVAFANGVDLVTWHVDSIVYASPRPSETVVPVHRLELMQSWPVAFWNGATPNVAWDEHQFLLTNGSVYVGIRGSAAGTVASGALADAVSSPTGNLFLVREGSSLYATLNGRTTLLTTNNVQGSFDVPTARVARTASGFMAVWSEWTAGTYAPIPIFAARLLPDGSMADTAYLIATVTDLRDIEIAAHDDTVLVACLERGATITSVLLDDYGLKRAAPIPVVAVSVGVASDGSDFLVTWSNRTRVQSARIDSNGGITLGKTIVLSDSSFRTRAWPFWNGTHYVTIVVTQTTSDVTKLWALELDRDGNLLGTSPHPIGEFNGTPASAARSETGDILLAYTRGRSYSESYFTAAYTRMLTVAPSRRRAASHR